MRVGLSAYLLHRGSDYRAAGVSVYIYQLLTHLVREGGNDYLAFVGDDAPPIDGLPYVVSPVTTRAASWRIPWEQLVVPIQARSRGIDVLHATVNVAPVLFPGPIVVTVHDLAFLRYPELFARQKALYLKAAVKISVRRADQIIAVSENTRNDLIDLMDVRPDRVSVIHHGVDRSFRPLESRDFAATRARLDQKRPYVLYVGTLEPRKNVDVLISAFARARENLALPHQLVLAGAPGWRYENLFQQVSELGLQDEVKFLGYVDPGLLALWYNAADLFVYPPAYEGFGLPLLEAMSCGVPCITSASSALREIGGGACLQVEPGSEEGLQMAITRMVTDPALRARLRQEGVRRASNFTWSRAARETLTVYARAASHS
ncbi:MAG: glycosyltransferase family 4 protein [Chloroflexota bacterium]|nr:MAG: glycosyltransferase family 1 protein [Chloroflexota bacterium]